MLCSYRRLKRLEFLFCGHTEQVAETEKTFLNSFINERHSTEVVRRKNHLSDGLCCIFSESYDFWLLNWLCCHFASQIFIHICLDLTPNSRQLSCPNKLKHSIFIYRNLMSQRIPACVIQEKVRLQEDMLNLILNGWAFNCWVLTKY